MMPYGRLELQQSLCRGCSEGRAVHWTVESSVRIAAGRWRKAEADSGTF